MKSKTILFLELAVPNEYGFSREVHINEFINEYDRLNFHNGCDFARKTSEIGKKYNVVFRREKNKIVSITLEGFNKNATPKQIRGDIKKVIQSQKCRVLHISSVEVDHKDGHNDDYSALKLENQKLEDFQPLSPSVNKAKRQHCKICRGNKVRFDARLLGYSKAQWIGSINYNGSCVGCYWYDVKKFNEEISKIKYSEGE